MFKKILRRKMLSDYYKYSSVDKEWFCSERYMYEVEDYRKFIVHLSRFGAFDDDDYCEYVIDLLRQELRYSSLLEVYRWQDENRYDFPFNEMSKILFDCRPNGKIEIDIKENNLISCPRREDRYMGVFPKIKENGFKYDETNHSATYYDGLNITCADNGLHSLGVGSYFGKGKIIAEYFDIKKVFDYVDVNDDLSFTYNREAILKKLDMKSNQCPYDTELRRRFYGTDYRLILIYYFSQWKYKNKRKLDMD